MHAAINAIIHRSLAAVNGHQHLSPLAYAYQMASDLTVVPLPHGSLASVFTCVDTSLQGKLEL